MAYLPLNLSPVAGHSLIFGCHLGRLGRFQPVEERSLPAVLLLGAVATASSFLPTGFRVVVGVIYRADSQARSQGTLRRQKWRLLFLHPSPLGVLGFVRPLAGKVW